MELAPLIFAPVRTALRRPLSCSLRTASYVSAIVHLPLPVPSLSRSLSPPCPGPSICSRQYFQPSPYLFALPFICAASCLFPAPLLCLKPVRIAVLAHFLESICPSTNARHTSIRSMSPGAWNPVSAHTHSLSHTQAVNHPFIVKLHYAFQASRLPTAVSLFSPAPPSSRKTTATATPIEPLRCFTEDRHGAASLLH
jgi:hypothetical protein